MRLTQRLLRHALLLACAVILLLAPEQAIAADNSSVGELTAVLYGDMSKAPDIGDRVDALPKDSADAPTSPAALTEHGDTQALRQGITYTNSVASTPAAAAAPETLASCRTRSGGTEYYAVINHYASCYVHYGAGINWLLDGRVVGSFYWRTTTVGEGLKGSRVVYLTTGMDQFQSVGTTAPTQQVPVIWTSGGYNGSDGSNAPCGVNETASHSITEWVAGMTQRSTISTAQTDGYGRDSVARCALQQWFGASGSTHWIPLSGTGVRFDSASYLGSNGAGIFDRVMPRMSEYSVTSARNGAVAQHVQLAQTNPNATYPPKSDGSAKSIPGGSTSGIPLTRLMSTWDAAATSQYNKNRSTTSSACAGLTHQTGEECDEYPFASTWEGSGKGDGNFSIKYVDGTQNGNAGTDLNNWYIQDRILHNDKFYVDIRP